MIENKLLPDQRIIHCLNSDYGIKITTLIFLPLGADIEASLYRAEAQDHSAYFVKIQRTRNQNMGAILLGFLQDAGVQRIIPPIKTMRGQLAQQIGDLTLVVYPFVEGENGLSSDLTENQWMALGKLLRQVHEITVPLSLQAMIRREDYSPKWREAVRSLYAHIQSEPTGDEIATKLILFMKQQAVAIHRLVDRAEQLSQKILEQPPACVFCHSDIHGGNVLIDENDSIYVVDWDDVILAPRECDLMFIGGGVANSWNKPHEAALFYKGYGKTAVNNTLLAYYRHERIVEDIAVYAQQILFIQANEEEREQSYQHFIAQFEPHGVVEIAFQTDENQHYF